MPCTQKLHNLKLAFNKLQQVDQIKVLTPAEFYRIIQCLISILGPYI